MHYGQKAIASMVIMTKEFIFKLTQKQIELICEGLYNISIETDCFLSNLKQLEHCSLNPDTNDILAREQETAERMKEIEKLLFIFEGRH